jgi:hypothetical protein
MNHKNYWSWVIKWIIQTTNARKFLMCDNIETFVGAKPLLKKLLLQMDDYLKDN